MLDLALVGLHLLSDHHPGKPYQNNANLGAYVETVEGWTAGGYRNTLDRTSLYAGYTFRLPGYERWALTLGGVSGYQKEQIPRDCPTVNKRHKTHYTKAPCYETLGWSSSEIAPMLAPSVNIGPARLWYIPKIGEASSVLHLSVEWKLR